MKRNNNLSNNLRAFQKARHVTQAEFAQALDVPKSTLQSVMLDGNTTLDTLIHLADALNVTLDELVFEADLPGREGVMRSLLISADWYANLSPEQQKMLCYHLGGLIKLLTRDEVPDTVNDVGHKHDSDL